MSFPGRTVHSSFLSEIETWNKPTRRVLTSSKKCQETQINSGRNQNWQKPPSRVPKKEVNGKNGRPLQNQIGLVGRTFTVFISPPSVPQSHCKLVSSGIVLFGRHVQLIWRLLKKYHCKMMCSPKTRTENQNKTKFRSHHCSVMVPIQMKHMCQIGSSAQKHKSLTPTTCQTANWYVFLIHQHIWRYLSCYPTCLSTKRPKNLYRIIS